MANPNFLGAAAFAVEKVVKRDFKHVWSSAHPLLATLSKRKARNIGTISGLRLILPVAFQDATTPADGQSDANAFTPITPYVTNGFTQAQYEFSYYRHAFYLTPHEKQLLMNGYRGNILEGKTKQSMESFRNAISDDLAGNVTSQRENVLGLRFALATANTVGNIDQSANAWWRAERVTGAGPFDLKVIDNMYDTIRAKGRSVPDLLLLSNNSSVNVFGMMRDQVAVLQRITSTANDTNFGFADFSYLGMRCVLDNRLGAALSTDGGAMMLSTDTWYQRGLQDNIQPELDKDRLAGTGSQEFYFDLWLALGCDDIASNGYITGIS